MFCAKKVTKLPDLTVHDKMLTVREDGKELSQLRLSLFLLFFFEWGRSLQRLNFE